jgi:hypothetical protein
MPAFAPCLLERVLPECKRHAGLCAVSACGFGTSSACQVHWVRQTNGDAIKAKPAHEFTNMLSEQAT